MSTPRHTPIRRISRGSFSGGAARGHSATPLAFLCDEALPILAEETTALQDNLEQLHEMRHALSTFNESFAMFLYGIKMNAFCVEWPEAPDADLIGAAARAPPAEPAPAADTSYTTEAEASADIEPVRLAEREGRPEGPSTRPAARPAGRSARPAERPPARQPARQPARPTSRPTSRPPTNPPTNPANPARVPPAVRRRREALADDIIQTMPLEYRGDNSTQRGVLESVIHALAAAGERGVRVADIARPPDLPSGRVNKALLALVAARHATRASDNVRIY